MDTFQKSVLIIALVVLIALLISVGILLNKHSKNTSWPPIQNTCPDYWTEGDNGVCTTVINGLNTGPDGSVISTADADGKNVTGDTTCEKRRWAIENGIMWSGVSNYNSCN
jgi:hypothetical protein